MTVTVTVTATVQRAERVGLGDTVAAQIGIERRL